MSGLTINALCAGYGKRRIIEHLSISSRRAAKSLYCWGLMAAVNQRYCAPWPG